MNVLVIMSTIILMQMIPKENQRHLVSQILFVVCSYVMQENQRQENSLPGSRAFKL